MRHTIRMRYAVSTLALAAVLSADVLVRTAELQAPTPPAPTASQTKSLVQLRVQVTIVRYSGDKKTASLPFTLWVYVDGDPTSLNAAQNVLVPSVSFASAAGTPPPSYSTQNVGTRIVCSAAPSGDGRFKVSLNIGDSHLVPAKADGGTVTLKSLQTSNSLLLRDGQTAEFVAATDPISGEVTRIDVTATTLK